MKPWYIKNTHFSNVTRPEDREMFMRICPERQHAKGSVIFRQGDPATALHIIAAGQVKLTTVTSTGQARILAICGPSDFIGEAFLREAQYYRVDAVALTDAVTCPMSRNQFLELSLHAPHFVLSFAEILAGNLFYCREQLSSSFHPVKERLIKVLLEQADRFGEEVAEGWCEFKTELKHDDLASLVSATRVAVTSAMSQLREAGLLEGSRGAYRLYVPGLRSLLDA